VANTTRVMGCIWLMNCWKFEWENVLMVTVKSSRILAQMHHGYVLWNELEMSLEKKTNDFLINFSQTTPMMMS
jgi:hypothetical protein